MTAFRKYEKVYRLGKEETDGILNGTCYIQEKIDGANASIWLNSYSDVCVGSRNRDLGEESFNGLREYVLAHSGISEFLHNNPSLILYGEWLVPHTVKYNEDSYKKFYLYDIFFNGYEYPHHVKHIADTYDIPNPWHMATLKDPTVEQLKEFVGKSALGPQGEGIVIKNPDFLNRWNHNVYAKLVTDTFMENNALVFGSNNKFAENYNELYIINKWMTEGRVNKIAEKVKEEITEQLDMKHIPRICNTAYYDMISEEAWEIAKMKKAIDYKQLERLAFNKAKMIYIERLNG